MEIYEDGYILGAPDNTEVLLSPFNLVEAGSFLSETDYTIKQGDSLFSIARDYYRDTRLWFIINEWNTLEDPIVLVTGTAIKLPNFG